MTGWTIYSKSNVAKAKVKELEYHGEWMRDEYVTVTVKSAEPVDFAIGDYLEYRGERFFIDYDTSVIKKAKSGSYGEAFVYENVKMYSIAHSLGFITFKDYVLNDNMGTYSSQAKFSFFAGSVEDLADRVQANLDKATSDGWLIMTPNKSRTQTRLGNAFNESMWNTFFSKSQIGLTDKNISCDGISCKRAIELAYEIFGLTFFNTGTAVIIGGTLESYVPDVSEGYVYGKGNGLSEIQKVTDESQEIITKLYAYGSSENLPLNYYAYPSGTNTKVCSGNVTAVVKSGVGTETPTATVTLDVAYSPNLFNGEESDGYDGRAVRIISSNIEISARADYVREDNGYVRLSLFAFSASARTVGGEVNITNLNTVISNLSVGDSIELKEGVDKNAWPIRTGDGSQSLGFLSVSNLMLPGFNKTGGLAGNVSGHDPNNKFTYSDQQTDPWIESKAGVQKYGVREGVVYFDGSGDEGVIRPSIEGTGAEFVTLGSSIEDNGYLANAADISFKIRTAWGNGNGFDWQDAWDNKVEDIYIEMKSGYCTGRRFRMVARPQIYVIENQQSQWILKLEREHDTSLDRYFPYQDASGFCQVQSGDKFVATGLQMPKTYVDAAELRLLDAAQAWLSKHDHERVTYIPKIDEIFAARQRDELEGTQDKWGGIYYRLHPGVVFSFKDEQLTGNVVIAKNIDTVTIKENGNNGIPTFDIVLREEKDEDLLARIRSEVSVLGGGSGSGSGGGGSSFGGVSKEDMYYMLGEKVDCAWFSRLFELKMKVTTTITEEDQQTHEETVISVTSELEDVDPNEWPSLEPEESYDEENHRTTTVTKEIDSIKAKYGFWTEHFLSSLGKNPDEGGGILNLNEPLASINNALLGVPQEQGVAIMWNGSTWGYQVPGGSGGGGGTVTSVGLSMPDGFSVGAPVTGSGTLEVTFGGTLDANKVLASPNGENGAPSWRSLVSADIPYLPASKINSGQFGVDRIPDLSGRYATVESIVGMATQSWVNNQNFATQGWINNQGFATQSWVNQQGFMTIEAFERLFNALASDNETKINHPYSSGVASIKAMVGLWTDEFLSALGLSNSGGGAALNQPLASINESDMSAPGSAQNGMTVVWDNAANKWKYGTAGSGSVTSIGMTVPTGFSVNPSTITTNGIFAITFASGYSLPTNAKQTNWDSAYSWVNTNSSNVAMKDWVGQHYLSIDFFSSLFKAFAGNVEVTPNSDTTNVDNIKAMFGFWTEQYISALGKNDSQSGIDAVLKDLLDVDDNLNPSNGQTLVYNATSRMWTSGNAGMDLTALASYLSDKTLTIKNGNTTLGTYVPTGASIIDISIALSGFITQTTADGRYVSALGTSGNYLTWTKNGTVNNITVPYSLNSDKLDGAHGTEFYSLSLNNVTTITSGDDLNNYTTAGTFFTSGGNQGSSVASSLLNKPTFSGGFRMYVTTADPDGKYIAQRIVTYGGRTFDRFSGNIGSSSPWSDSVWRELAYTDSNVASATKLADNGGHKVWGQTYWNNGQPISGNITGAMSGVTNISMAGSISGCTDIDSLLYFQAGTIGIGTSAPNTNYKLDVDGYTKTSRLYLSDTIYLRIENDGVHVVGGGLYADTYISALGLSDSGDPAFDETAMWEALGRSGNQQINSSHLTTALNGYALTSQIPTSLKNPYKLTITLNGTPTEYDGSVARNLTINTGLDQQALETYLTSKVLTVKNGATTLGTWNPTAAGAIDIANALSGFITQTTADGRYLKLSGGTITGNIKGDDGSHLRVRMSRDTSNAIYGLEWLDTSDSRIGGILFHNTSQKMYFNTIGASEVYNDAVGKYSLVIGNNLLTYNTYDIYHKGNLSALTASDLTTGTSTTSSLVTAKVIADYVQNSTIANCVTALGVSGNYLTWTKNGITNNITVPYATNADTLDELHKTAFPILSVTGSIALASGDDLNTLTDNGTWYSSSSTISSNILNTPHTSSNFKVMTMKMGTNSYALQFGFAYTDKVYIRGWSNNNGWRDWHTVAFLDSNVASASRLADNTSKAAWGQNYWVGGVPQNISGDMTGVGNISFSASGKNIGGLMSFITAGNGTVGIGTLSPNTNYKLDVNGYTKTSRLYLSDTIYLTIENDGVHIVGGGLYADTYISALGLSDDSSPAFDVTAMWQALATIDSSHKIDNSHLSLGLLTLKDGSNNTLGTWTPTADGIITVNTYTHPTNGANTTITAANKKVLSAITVNNLGHVTSVSSKTLTSLDIPDISADYATSGRVSTLEGFFTNGVAKNADKLDDIDSTGFGRLFTHDLSNNSSVRITFDAAHSAVIFGRSSAGYNHRIVLIGNGYSSREHWKCVDIGGNVTWAVSTTSHSVEIKYTNSTTSKLYISVLAARGTVTFTSISDLTGTAVTDRLASLTDNVASATKLETSRSIWGQSFDGTAPISGAMTGVTNIDSLLYLDTSNSQVIAGTSTAGTFTHSGNTYVPKIYSGGEIGASGGLWCGFAELYYATPYIDFHYGRATYDYTSRIIENESGVLTIQAKASGTDSVAGLKIGSVNGANYLQVGTTNANSTNQSYVQIGNIRLVYDYSNNALRVQNATGGAANLYALGGISALGISSNTNGEVAGSLIPSASGTYTLGSASRGWTDIYLYDGDSARLNIYADSGDAWYDCGNGRHNFEQPIAVTGTGYFTGKVSIGGTNLNSDKLYVNGTVRASGYNNTSDIRLKAMVRRFQLSVEEIARAPLFTFRWKADGDGGKLLAGSSAQYWRAVLPEVVTEDADGTLGMDYGVTALVSVGSVARKVMTHEEEIAALKKRVGELEEEVELLKAA